MLKPPAGCQDRHVYQSSIAGRHHTTGAADGIGLSMWLTYYGRDDILLHPFGTETPQQVSYGTVEVGMGFTNAEGK